MKKHIILVALISFSAISFTAKSQTTFDTKNCQYKVVINKNELFFREVADFTPPNKTEYREGSEVVTPRKLPTITKRTVITFKSGVYNNVAKNTDWTNTPNSSVAEIYLMDDKGKAIQHWSLSNVLITSVKSANKTAAVVKIDTMVISGSFIN